MFTDTGNISLYLGASFIVLTLLGFITAAIFIMRSGVEGSKIQTLIDLGKWMLTSVAIVVGASIVGDAFKEREQDVKEFAVFDKYVDTVTTADSIEKRALLADYFAIVAPEGELRNSWKAYKKHVDEKLVVYLAEKEELRIKKSLENPTAADQVKIAQLEASTTLLEQSILPAPRTVPSSSSPMVSPVSPVFAPPVGNWLVVASSDENLTEGQYELEKARKISPAAQLYKKGNLFLTVIPAFKTQADAAARLAEIRRVVNKDAYVLDADKLCPKLDVAKGYVVCG